MKPNRLYKDPAAASFLEQLAALKEEGRDAVLALAQEWLLEERKRIQRRFLKDGDVTKLMADLTLAVDTLIAGLFHRSTKTKMPALALVAVGGYGRGELFPYSDIDLIFLHGEKDAKEAGRIAETILYLLWDMKLSVGQATRTVKETLALAAQDIQTRTTLLDMRLIAGSEELLAECKQRFERDIAAGSAIEFVEAKLTERDERHRRFGDSRYVLEPNIKEGKGGLRDLHTLWWLARYVYSIGALKDLVDMELLTREEYRDFDRARLFLCKVRAHLHYLAGHAQEQLDFASQHALAVAMGYTHADPNRAVERFMRRYFAVVRMVGEATRVFCALLEEEKKRKPKTRLAWLSSWKLGRFTLDGERLSVRQAKSFTDHPLSMLEIFRVSQQHGLGIHPRALRWLARQRARIDEKMQRDPRAGKIFLDILLDKTGAEDTLRKMSDAGVLERFIPEFGRIIGQTQFNLFHIYTVDEHTLVAIGILHAIENGERREELPLASQVISRVSLRRALYLALFCHDIAKGGRGDHSDLGAKIALRLSRRLGFSEEEAGLTAWLVKHHLLFSDTAFKRDLNDPKTIQDFIAAVQSTERLRMLMLLTVADMRAVGGSIWNAWKASLIEDLYRRSEQALATGRVAFKEQHSDEWRTSLLALLPGWKKKELAAYLDQTTPEFLAGLDLSRHATVARMCRQALSMEEPLLIDTQHDYERANSEITVMTHDRPALFSKLAGALSLAGANITSARIFTLKNGLAVDIFQVQDATHDVFDRPDRLAKVSVYIEQALSGDIDFGQAFAESAKPYDRRRQAHRVSGQVFIENDASNLYTVIEINGRDRLGFLYQVTKTMHEFGLSIVTAHISTYGIQAADVFYVKDQFGMKATHAGKLQQIHDALVAAVNNPARA